MNDLAKISILFDVFSFLNPCDQDNFKCMVFIYENISKVIWSKMQRNMTDNEYKNVLTKINSSIQIAIDQNECVDDLNIYSKIVKIKVSFLFCFHFEFS